MINTLSQTRALFDCIEPMEPLPTIGLTRQEMERAALDLGAKFQTIRQWRYRNIPTPWQLKLIKHFGAMIVIDDVACADLPPVKQRTLSREVSHTFGAFMRSIMKRRCNVVSLAQ